MAQLALQLDALRVEALYIYLFIYLFYLLGKHSTHHCVVGAHQRQGQREEGKKNEKSEEEEREQRTQGETFHPIPDK